MDISLSVEGLAELQALWRSAPDVVQDELISGAWEAELLLEREIKEATPVGATGALSQSIGAHTPQVFGNKVIGAVGTSLAHAVPVELGTKPHMPPIEPLVDWVKAKLDLHGREAYGVAKMIQYKIAARGTKGARMFNRTFAAQRGQVNRIYQRAHGRVIERLGTLH